MEGRDSVCCERFALVAKSNSTISRRAGKVVIVPSNFFQLMTEIVGCIHHAKFSVKAFNFTRNFQRHSAFHLCQH